MDDSPELKIVSTPEELSKLEHSDLCVTLYTIWDRLQDRGSMAGKRLFSCRNDSCVPDAAFGEFAQKALAECESVADHGELFVLSSASFDELRESIGGTLRVALDAL